MLQICVCGWYLDEKFYTVLGNIDREKFQVNVVSHKGEEETSTLCVKNNLRHVVKNNVGLEFGAYDYFLKNMWNNESPVLFIHDDTIIHDPTVFDRIARLKEEGIEQAYIFKNKAEEDNNGGKHGRAIYIGEKLLAFMLKFECNCGHAKGANGLPPTGPHTGFWFDPNNIGHSTGSQPEGVRHYNTMIYHFHAFLGRVRDKKYDLPPMRVNQKVFFQELNLGRRGEYRKERFNTNHINVSLIIAVLDSQEVTKRQILHFSKFLTKYLCELIIMDDGSKPPLKEYLKKVSNDEWSFIINGNSITYVDLYGGEFKFRIIETNDERKWSQPCARNSGASIAHGAYLMFTDLDHVFTEENVKETIAFKGDKLLFGRDWGVLNEKGELSTDKNLLIEYGCNENNFNKSAGTHANSFVMKKSIFVELGGYDKKFCGKYGGDDVDLNNRYGALHYGGKVNRSVHGKSRMTVYPDPKRDIKKIFHSLR